MERAKRTAIRTLRTDKTKQTHYAEVKTRSEDFRDWLKLCDAGYSTPSQEQCDINGKTVFFRLTELGKREIQCQKL